MLLAIHHKAYICITSKAHHRTRGSERCCLASITLPGHRWHQLTVSRLTSRDLFIYIYLRDMAETTADFAGLKVEERWARFLWPASLRRTFQFRLGPPAIVDLHKSWISLICTPAAVLSTLLPDDNGRRDEPSHPKNSHNPGQGLLNTYSSFLNFDPGTRDP